MSNDVTIGGLEDLSAQIAAQRDVIDEMSAAKKLEEKKLYSLEQKMLATLEAIGKSSYQAKVGTLYISNRKSVKVPATPEDREAFFNYLRERGIFEKMITVHSATLTSYYNAEFDEAVAEGRDLEIPGIGEPTITQSIGFRTAK